jgi:hypothetical protein
MKFLRPFLQRVPSRRLRHAAAGLLILLAAMTPALAAFHLNAIQEVFVGPPSDMVRPSLTPDQRAQYVMIRMTSSGQTLLTNTSIRVEDAAGYILGRFGTFTAGVANGGSVGCAYPNCPAVVIGTTAARNLVNIAFDQIVDGQAGRVALPVAGGRACFTSGTSVLDCVAWGTFSCTAANCPGGTNALHAGDLSGNVCASSFGTPAASGGLQYGKGLSRTAFSCPTKSNSTQFALQFPKPVDNAGVNINTDTDGDGLVDALDCAKTDAATQWAPVEVQNLRVSGQPTSTDSWDSQAAFVGTGVAYDEIRGTLSHLVGFTDQQCLSPATTATSSTDGGTPPAGDGFYYLVRARGAGDCIGTYGNQVPAGPRDPLLTICP